jgi:hypothetical protein
MRRILSIFILLGGLALALTACRGSSDPGLPSASGNPTTTSRGTSTVDLTAFGNCLRQHGVNVAMPNPGVDLQAWARQQAEQNADWDAASRACQNLMPPAADGQQDPLSAQELEQLRAYAVCMRANDIEVTDPDQTGNIQIGGRLERVTRAQLDNDPGFTAATAACQDKLPDDSRVGNPAK